MRRVGVSLAAAAMLTGLAGCGSSAGSAAQADSADAPTVDAAAVRLAQLDGSTDLVAYKAALDEWQSKCQQDRTTDAGYVDAAFRDEQSSGGPDPSRLVVMRNLTASVPDGVAPTDCAGVAASYLLLVEPAGS